MKLLYLWHFSVDEVIKLMFKGGITAYTLSLFVPMRCLQSCNPVDESLFECLLQRLCDLSGKLESATFSVGYTNSFYSSPFQSAPCL